MNIWKVLQISECKDKEKIINAYRERLMVTNPEDSPEEFKELRAAYEEALKYAGTPDDEEETEPVDNSEEGVFIEKAKAIYDCFSDRLDIEKWKQLLSDDLCFSLDTKVEIRNRLLVMFMERFRLPRKVWQLLDETFQLKENKAELLELFPEHYIENAIIAGIDHEPAVKLELFEGPDDAEYDQYIRLYFDITNAIDERRMDDVEEMMERLNKLEIQHPYAKILEIRLALIDEAYEKARTIAEHLYQQLSEDYAVKLYMGETALHTGRIEEARDFYNQVLEQEEDNFMALYGLASCLIKEGKDEEAKEAFYEMLKFHYNNNGILAELQEINQRLIEQYKQQWQDDNTDAEAAHNLGWCYLQNNKIKEGLELIGQFTPAHKDRFGYLNLCGRLYLEAEEPEKALQYFQEWEAAGVDLQDDGSEEVKKELGRLELPVFMQSVALLVMNKDEEALACVERSLAIKDSREALYQKILILYNLKRYEDALTVCGELQQLAPEMWNQYLMRGRCLYELGRYPEAFESFNDTLNHYAYSLDAYIFKIRILHSYGQYDQAQELVDYLIQQKVESDRLEVCRAQLLEEEGCREEAQAIYQQVIKNCQERTSDIIDEESYVYYLLAVSLEHNSSFGEITHYISQGLERQPDDIRLLDYQGYIYKKHDEAEKAQKSYRKILAIEPDHYSANENIGDIYFEDDQYMKALAFYKKAASLRKNAYICEMLGRTYLQINDYKEALYSFGQAIELNPQEAGNYYYASLASMYRRDLQQALQYSQQAVEVMEAGDKPFRDARRLLAQNYARLGQYQEALAALEKNRDTFGNGENLQIMYMQMRAGNYQAALELLEQWYSHTDKEDKQYIYDGELASLYFYMRDWDKGYKVLKKSRCKYNSQYLLEWGYYMMKNNLRKAANTAKKYITTVPGSHMGYYLLGKTAFYRGKKKLAAEMAEKSLKILMNIKDKTDDQAYYLCQQAKCRVILGDYDEFFKLIETIGKSHLCMDCYAGSCYELHEAMAFYYEVTGAYDKAAKEFETALSLCKNRYLLLLEAESLKMRTKRL